MPVALFGPVKTVAGGAFQGHIPGKRCPPMQRAAPGGQTQRCPLHFVAVILDGSSCTAVGVHILLKAGELLLRRTTADEHEARVFVLGGSHTAPAAGLGLGGTGRAACPHPALNALPRRFACGWLPGCAFRGSFWLPLWFWAGRAPRSFRSFRSLRLPRALRSRRLLFSLLGPLLLCTGAAGLAAGAAFWF